MIVDVVTGAALDQAADPGNYARAILNILTDFGEEKTRLADVQRAMLNILEDSDAEKLRLEAVQKAALNILADFNDERTKLADVQKAVLNILEDFAGEKARLEATQKAVLNILEDFDAEKTKVEQINREMTREIGERKRAEEALREADQRAIRDYEHLLERLSQLAQVVGTARDLTAVYRSLRRFVEASVPCNGLFVSLYDPQRQQRICVYSGGNGEEDDVATLPPLPMNDSPQSRAIATGQVVVTDDFQAAVAGKPVVTLGTEQDPRLPQSSIAVPLTVLGRVIGAFEVQSVERAAFKPEHVTAMRMAANLAAIATENVQMLERERQLRLGAEMSEERYRTLAEAAQDSIFIINRDRNIEYMNSFGASRFGLQPEEIIGKPLASLFPPEMLKTRQQDLQTVFESCQPLYIEYQRSFPDAREVWLSVRLAPIVDATGAVRAVLGISRDITESKRAEEEIRLRVEQLGTLYDAGLALNSVLDPHVQLEFLLKLAAHALRAEHAEFFRYNPARNEVQFESSIGYGAAEEKALREMSFPVGDEHGLVGWVAKNRVHLNVPDVSADPRWIAIDPQIRSALYAVVQHEKEPRGVLGVLSTRANAFSLHDERLLVLFGNQVAVAMENARLFEEAQRRAEQLVAVNTLGRALSETLDLDEIFERLYQSVQSLLPDSQTVFVSLFDQEQAVFRCAFAMSEGERINAAELPPAPLEPPGVGAQSEAVHTRRPFIVNDLQARLKRVRVNVDVGNGSGRQAQSGLYVPMLAKERVIGVVQTQSLKLDRYTPEHAELLSLVANTAAVAIQNARLFEEEQTRRAELGALYDLSRVLADAPYVFDIILDLVARRAVETIHVTFARLALIENGECVLRAAYPARGLERDLGVGRHEAIQQMPVCYRASQQNAPVILHRDDPELTDTERDALFLAPSAGSGQVLAQSLCLVPLRSGDRALGLLMLGEARREERESFTPEKINLARSIADQAASALHRAELFTQLEHSYLETVLALANAVDAKDMYTADHAQRLAQMALAVGREIDLTPRELDDLRYGAILHDIGKIGVPDSILKKPAKLDADEWKIMRQHPEIGARILAPISRLVQAARIVRHHHERVDGKGYPDGLSGETIPLGARILTIVDSYSAIMDKRVYKEARSQDEALTELKKHAGTQFDPHIVEIFLQLLERGVDITGGGGVKEYSALSSF
ncbi:MAG: GAF domain-containing protein [Chloroflexi bacterium]|nr:GAF domain-containing protein [Chloroflexota bacterium]